MPKPKWPASEQDLAAVVVDHFKAAGWEVFQEVAPEGYGTALDILCRRGPVLHAIECKMSLNFDVIEQAHRWLPYAHRVSVATPYGRHSWFRRKVCGDYGIGVMHPSSPSWGGMTTVHIDLEPGLRRRIKPKLLEHVQKFHIEGIAVAGQASGGRCTPFRATVTRLVEVVAAANQKWGVGLYDAVDRINHHWGTQKAAYRNVRHYIETGVIAELVVSGRGQDAKLRLRSEAQPGLCLTEAAS